MQIIKHNLPFNLNEILTIGLVNDQLMIITKEFQIFNFDIIYHLDYYDINVPVKNFQTMELKDRFPILFNNTEFQHYKYSFQAIIMHAEQSYWLCLFHRNKSLSIKYDILNDKIIINNWTINPNETSIFISSDKEYTFYTLKPPYFKFVIQLIISNDLNNKPIFGVYRTICRWNNQLFMVSYIDRCQFPVPWWTLVGFAAYRKLYIFDRLNVYIFDEKILYDSRKVEKDITELYWFKKTTYEEFFNLPPDIIPRK